MLAVEFNAIKKTYFENVQSYLLPGRPCSQYEKTRMKWRWLPFRKSDDILQGIVVQTQGIRYADALVQGMQPGTSMLNTLTEHFQKYKNLTQKAETNQSC